MALGMDSSTYIGCIRLMVLKEASIQKVTLM